jgi:CRP/FNR family transcriptional regulator
MALSIPGETALHRSPQPTDAMASTTAHRIAEALDLLRVHVPLQRRVVHAGDTVYRSGERFDMLFVINAGFLKTVNGADDGREQVVGLHLKGDWLGFDGIAAGAYRCEAVAMDTGEVWALKYEDLLAACRREPALLALLHGEMSREIARERDAMMAKATLPADARVAEFLRAWADALDQRGLRCDQITLRMTRAEIGNYLGMTLETVSRALSRLARGDVIRFPEKGRRDIQIPKMGALTAFVRSATGAPCAVAMH